MVKTRIRQSARYMDTWRGLPANYIGEILKNGKIVWTTGLTTYRSAQKKLTAEVKRRKKK